MNTQLEETFTAAIHPISIRHNFAYCTVNRGENLIVLYDTASMIGGDAFAYDLWMTEAVEALYAQGLELVESGARGGPEGGYYSVWGVA